METPTCNSHQITEDVDRRNKPECKEFPPLKDASSPMHTSLVFVDVTCIDVSPILLAHVFIIHKVLMVNLFQENIIRILEVQITFVVILSSFKVF